MNYVQLELIEVRGGTTFSLAYQYANNLKNNAHNWQSKEEE